MDNTKEQLSTSEQPLEIERDWRRFFSRDLLQRAQTFLDKGCVEDFTCGEREASASLRTSKSYPPFRARIQNAPDCYSADWDADSFSCNCVAKTVLYIRRAGERYSNTRIRVCAHEAAVLLYWEKQHGPWRVRESEQELAARLERVRMAQEEARQEAERRAEKARKAEERRAENARIEAEKNTLVPAVDFFPPPDDDTFFNLRICLKKTNTSQFYLNRARKLLETGTVKMEPPVLGYSGTGEQILNAEGTVHDGRMDWYVEVALSAHRLLTHSCGCQGWYYVNRQPCEHTLLLLKRLREYIQANNPGDATDLAAADFLSALSNLSNLPEETAKSVEKLKTVVLSPRLILDEGKAYVSFKTGIQGNRLIFLRSYGDFLSAVEEGKAVAVSKTVQLDFSNLDFTEDSLPWLQFIQRRVSDTQMAQEQLNRSGYYRSLSTGARIALTGATLDRFYELAEGTSCEFQDKNTSSEGTIRIGHSALRVHLTVKRYGTKKNFQGVEVTGEMPAILRGSAGNYVFSSRGLSRISREEAQFLHPFQKAAASSGQIRFRVGKNNLAEYYYRAVPRLLESPFVDLDDQCEEEAAPYLPPEPVFTFRVDVDGDSLLCDASVQYGDAPSLSLLGEERRDEQEQNGGTEPNQWEAAPVHRNHRDAAQEKRVDAVLRRYFTAEDSARYREELTEESLYRLLSEGLPELERYGTVLGSEAFRRSELRPVPSFKISVSIEGGLLDLSILSKDASPEELLDLLESYRQKKRYHRLRSGDFVNLTDSEELASLDELTQGLDITAEDVILHGAEMPIYRALYLDRLLEAHDALASSRDRTYRALIRNFSSIRDADYEVPEEQGDILRPYQVYGYKWLRTLSAAGFGGILADEMGLGKTLQTIALMQSLRSGGDRGPMLVVCPASLVYNWQEEFHRFAPGLSVTPVAGTAGTRKTILQALTDQKEQDANKEQSANTVYVTSYDLLRKDVALYEKAEFSVMVLDEAQYIKNQKAAMTKAVKGIRAKQRFALTGTPIENRLAELWSIFDFLMPGFLFSYTDFSRRFEAPITKGRDQAATARLKQMTGPFILRRLKTDVLKDLPAKLEEVRYSRFEEEQRRVYDGQVVRMRNLLAQPGETGQDKVKIFAELMRIRQICCDPSLLLEDYHGGSAKRDACLELVQSAMGGGHRMLVFSQFTSMLALLEEDLRRENIPYYKITGSTPKEQRIRLVRDFNEGDVPVFLISLKAGGTGLNLTGADVVIHYDPWWNVAAQNQATDRAHRIGQTRQVTVYRMIAKDTIEEKILEMQEAKRDLADAVLSGESVSLSSLSNEELLDLLS